MPGSLQRMFAPLVLVIVIMVSTLLSNPKKNDTAILLIEERLEARTPAWIND
jgi:hypothetical protein